MQKRNWKTADEKVRTIQPSCSLSSVVELTLYPSLLFPLWLLVVVVAPHGNVAQFMTRKKMRLPLMRAVLMLLIVLHVMMGTYLYLSSVALVVMNTANSRQPASLSSHSSSGSNNRRRDSWEEDEVRRVITIPSELWNAGGMLVDSLQGLGVAEEKVATTTTTTTSLAPRQQQSPSLTPLQLLSHRHWNGRHHHAV